MGLFRRPRIDPDELDRIREQLRYLREHFDAQRHGSNGVAANGTAHPSIEDVTTRLDTVAADVSTCTSTHDELRAALGTLDDRITSISTELANQITELGNDIEGLGERTPDGEQPARVMVQQLRTGQERLANEQARYQIAFREDLARIAEALRKTASR